MTFKKTLQHYYNKRIDAIITALKIEEEAFSTESFHHLRVEIKKLHAFFELLEGSVKKFPASKYFKPFKKIFKQLGIIRELQLEVEWLTKRTHQIPVTPYISYLQKQLKEETAIFIQLKDKLQKQIKNVGSKAFVYIDQIKKKKAAAFIKKQGHNIEGIISAPTIDVLLIHDLRKQLKSYVYLLKAMEQEEEQNSHEQMDDFQDLLGKWHDNQVMIGHFSSLPAHTSFPKETVENLARFSKRLQAASAKQRKKIALFLQDLVAGASY